MTMSDGGKFAALVQAYEALRSKSAEQLAAIQRESARVNELNGVVAFCAGAFAAIATATTLEEAQTCADMAAQSLDERHAGLWRPGPHDDPKDWKR